MKCPECGYLNRGEGQCYACGFQMTPEKEKKVYQIPKKSKKRQEVIDEDIEFFKEIWAEREHFSEVSGTWLGDEFNVCFFSHILTKQAFPRFRHYAKNIVLMTYTEHQEWEFTDRKHPKWNPIRDLAEDLVNEYYNPPTI